jgi:hypothetical protein
VNRVGYKLKGTFLVLVFGTVALGCGEDPCSDLMARQCAAAGESLCAAMKKEAAGADDSEARRQLCASILNDEQKLESNLDALRAAAALKAVAGNETPNAGQAPKLNVPEVQPGKAPPATPLGDDEGP